MPPLRPLPPLTMPKRRVRKREAVAAGSNRFTLPPALGRSLGPEEGAAVGVTAAAAAASLRAEEEEEEEGLALSPDPGGAADAVTHGRETRSACPTAVLAHRAGDAVARMRAATVVLREPFASCI